MLKQPQARKAPGFGCGIQCGLPRLLKEGVTPCPLLDAPGFLSSSMGRCFAGDCYEIRKSLIHFLS